MVIVLIAIFPVITNTLFGLQSADRLHHDLFTLNKASRWTRLWKLELPGAVPALMTGIRIASGGAVIGAVVADFFFTRGQKGIGFFIRVKQQRASERPEMFMGTILSSMFGVSCSWSSATSPIAPFGTGTTPPASGRNITPTTNQQARHDHCASRGEHT